MILIGDVLMLFTAVLMIAVTWTWYIAHRVLKEIRFLRKVVVPWMNGLNKQLAVKGLISDE